MGDKLSAKLFAAYERMEAMSIDAMKRDGITGEALDDAIAAMKRYNRVAREVFETQLREGSHPK